MTRQEAFPRTADRSRFSGFLLAAWLLAFQSDARAAAFSFGSPITVPPATSDWVADSVAVADFNGDGRDDLATTIVGHLEVHLQRSDGSLSPAMVLTLPSTHFFAVKAAALGATSQSRIVVGHDHGLTLYTWNGAGGFSGTDYPAPFACWNMAIGDVDSDGLADVFCMGAYDDAMLYSGNAASVLSSPRSVPFAVDGAGMLGQAQLADVTGDGKLDLVAVSGSVASLFVYPNDGHGGFLPPTSYGYPAEDYLWPNAVEVMDIDGDGANEVIAAKTCNSPCPSLYVYRRGALGYLTLSSRIPTYDIPEVLLTTDVDRDTHPDLLVVHAGWNAVGRYMGLGSAGLSNVELRSYLPLRSVVAAGGIAAGDLNHDGFVDLAVVNSFGGSILYGGRPAANDFNNDFVSDVLWRHANGANQIWLSANAGTQQYIQEADPAWSIEGVADFEGDGRDDVFWRNHATGANEIHLSSGNSSNPVRTVANQDWQVSGVGDFDGDGRADLFWRDGRTGANTIWKAADANMQQSTRAVTDTRWVIAGIGDFDGDGQDDVLWRHSTTGSNVIWRSGRADRQQPVSGVTNTDWRVAGVGDFNGDGRADVVWRNVRTGANTIWRSANAALLQTVTGVTNLSWGIAATGDYDGDGRSDLLWHNASSGANTVWRTADSSRLLAVPTMADTGWKPVP